MTNNLLTVKNLEKKFPVQRGLLKRTVGYIHAVDESHLKLLKVKL